MNFYFNLKKLIKYIIITFVLLRGDCEKAFMSKCNLIKHIMMHSGLIIVMWVLYYNLYFNVKNSLVDSGYSIFMFVILGGLEET